MATVTNTQGTPRLNRPGPPRKPQPDVNVHPDSRLAQQRPNQPTNRKDPFLLAHGFNGDINSFNNRVEKAYNGFANAYGREPSPGLVWDVARNPKVMDSQIQDLFQVPYDQRQVKAGQDHFESTWNGQGIHIREDGKAQPTNPITAWHASEEFHHQELQTIPHVLPVKKFQKRYPMIQMGMFPMLPFSGQFWKDYQLLHGNVDTIRETIGNMTPKQMEQLVAGGGAQGSALVGAQAGFGDQAQQFAQQQAAAAAQATYDPAKKKAVYDRTLQKYLGTSLGTEATQAFNKAHQRNVQRQEWLLKNDPNNLFQGLQPTGKFTKDWMVALDKWARTPGAANSYMQSLATQNYFAPTPAGIHAMQEAFKTKQEWVNGLKGTQDKWMAQSMPLKWFSNHTFPDPLLTWKNMPAALEKSMQDFWSYETTGINWGHGLLFPVGLLQMGFRGFKLGFNALGGFANENIAQGTALTTALGDYARGKTTKQIAKDYYDALKSNPDAVRALGFGTLPKNLKGSAAVLDQIGNFALQTAAAFLISGPGYFKLDENAPLSTWKRNPFMWLANKMAYTHIKEGDLGAAELLFGGRAADPFIRATEKGVQDGTITQDQFHHMASEFAHSGQTTLPDGSAFNRGGIHWSLRDKNMPKHVTSIAVKDALHRLEQRIETSALANRTTSSLGSFMQNTRSLLQIAQPLGKTPPIYELDVRALKTFINQNELLSEKDAQGVVSAFIKARATENTAGMDKLLQGVKDVFEKKYPAREAKGFPAQFERLLSTEGLVNARFPAREGRIKEGQTALNDLTDSGVNFANEAGRYWRTSIQATGPGLFYKHATRDPLAAFLGGMKLKQSTVMRQAAADMAKLADENPRLLRLLGSVRHQVIGAGTIYENSLRLADGEKAFHLMDEIHKTERSRWVMKWLGPKPNKEIATGAAEWLRNQVNDPLYPLYEEYLKTHDAAPLVEAALTDRNVFAAMKQATNLKGQLAKVKKDFRAEVVPHGQMLIPGTESATSDALKAALRAAKKDAAAAYVKMVIDRFDGIAQAGREAGMPDLMTRAAQLQRDKPGQSEEELARLLLKNQVNLRVPDGKIVPMSRWDRTTSKLIHAYMTPNRLARQRMFDHMSQQYFASLIKSGYDPEQAFEVAMQAAKTATQFHLLDFSNMLEFERKYRGFLPFFTKHRLFIKWLAGTIVHRPGLVMPLNLIGQHLDPFQRLNFTIDGIPFNLSFAKLLFLSSEQQPPTVPLFGFTPLGQASGLGGQITRLDPLINLWGHVAFDGFNYDSVAKHLDPYTRARLDKYMALYAMRRRMQHGLGSYVSPHEAFKYAAMRISVDLPINGMFITPMGISSPQNPPEIQKLNDQYDKLLTTNPKAAQELLSKHPEIGLAWGKAENFNVYNHMTQMWGMYDKIRAEYSKVEDKYSQMELEGKTLTPADYKAMHAASLKYSNQIQQLRMLDAQLWNHDTNNQGEPGYPAVTPEEMSSKQPYGPWYRQFSHDPLGTVQKLEQLFGGPKAWSAKDLHNVYGQDLVQAEVAISSAKDSTTREYWLNQIKRLEGAQKITADQTFYQAYHSAFSNYENKVFSYYNKAKTASGQNKALLEWKAAEAIRQEYEHPYITFKGKEVKVLPFAEYSTLQATPQTRIKEIFKNAIGFSYGSMTLDQRLALGLPDATPKLDAAWHEFEYNVAAYEQQTGKTASSNYRDALAIALNRQSPGFWKAYSISKMPRSFVLYDYGHGAFAGRYGEYWKEAVKLAIQAYNSNKYGWSDYVTNTLYPFIQARWPKGFQDELTIAGGANFLISLNTAWG